MDYIVSISLSNNIYWLHQPATWVSSIAWSIVYMFAPEAVGAMVGIASANYLGIAMLASKVFCISDKVFAFHRLTIGSQLITRPVGDQLNITMLISSPYGSANSRQPLNDFLVRMAVGVVATQTYNCCLGMNYR